MTTPTLIERFAIGADTFTVERATFVTPRGNCGVRLIHRVNWKRVTEEQWKDRAYDATRRVELEGEPR